MEWENEVTVDKIERALQGKLHDTIARLRDLGGAVTVEDPGGPEGAEEAAEGAATPRALARSGN